MKQYIFLKVVCLISIFILVCFILIQESEKKVFITFGGGGKQYTDAASRLTSQATKTEIFDRCIQFTDIELQQNTEFWGKHGEFIQSNKRGYGYWIWKPYIIKKTMEELKTNDIIVYLDAGCEIDIRKTKDLQNVILLGKQDLIVCSSTGQIEKKWNKMDTLLYLDANHEEYLNTEQYQATAILLVKNDITERLVNEWYEICSTYHLLDDSQSHTDNNPEFREHRHDQAIFSLLLKKYGISSTYNLSTVIEILRNRTGTEQVNKLIEVRK